ncbi:MAG: glycosyltransferase [Gammaproteobacteria bacterium]
MKSPESSPAPQVCRDPVRLPESPRVSVLMTTYNHAPYLAQAIEGVLSQQTDFPFELIIGEDASTDETRKIAREYQAQFPDRIVVVTADGNVGTYANIRRIFAESRGRYIAFCEGDDFWCAADKLARQVACFERDPRVGGVHSDWARMHHRDGEWIVNWRRPVHRHVPRALLEGDVFQTFYFPKILRTCTVMYRRDVLDEYYASPLGRTKYRFGDAAMAAFVSSRWRIGYVPDVTAVYRLSPRSALRSGRRARLLHMQSSLQFDDDARAFFEPLGLCYPTGFRWEICVGMFLWAVVVSDARAMGRAARAITRHHGFRDFLRDGWKSLAMRIPALLRKP